MEHQRAVAGAVAVVGVTAAAALSAWAMVQGGPETSVPPAVTQPAVAVASPPSTIEQVDYVDIPVPFPVAAGTPPDPVDVAAPSSAAVAAPAAAAAPAPQTATEPKAATTSGASGGGADSEADDEPAARMAGRTESARAHRERDDDEEREQDD